MPNSKRILVCGGAGFIGTNLVRRLIDQGHVVTVLDNLQTGLEQNLERAGLAGRVALRRCDITQTLPNLGSFDEIYNLACAASPPQYQADPIHTLLTSVNGTHALLQLTERCNARIVMASTSEVYGDPLQHPQAESYFGNVNPNGPRACYDEGKRAAETLCCEYLSRGTDVRIARIFNTYGPFMRADDGRVVSNVVCQALMGADITVYGDGSQTRSFCYVDDLVRGLMALMTVPGPVDGPVNLGNPQEFTINQLVELVLEKTGSTSRIINRSLPRDDPRQRCPDISRARSLLGWQPSTPLHEGLAPTIDWFAKVVGGRKPVDQVVALTA